MRHKLKNACPNIATVKDDRSEVFTIWSCQELLRDGSIKKNRPSTVQSVSSKIKYHTSVTPHYLVLNPNLQHINKCSIHLFKEDIYGNIWPLQGYKRADAGGYLHRCFCYNRTKLANAFIEGAWRFSPFFMQFITKTKKVRKWKNNNYFKFESLNPSAKRKLPCNLKDSGFEYQVNGVFTLSKIPRF